MAKIVVFDSGFGSLSIIRSIQKFTKSHIIYFADQKNFPYGKKSNTQLRRIIKQTIEKLEKRFSPDLVVIASNTPSILFRDHLNSKIFGILPPLREAVKLSKTNNIGILATHTAIKSTSLSRYINDNVPKKFIVKKIDATDLIDLVETGRFIDDQQFCVKKIRKTLSKTLTDKIDVVTLSSTHLPFLLSMLQKEFPSVKFLDPADKIAKKIAKRLPPSRQHRLEIHTSKDPKKFQKYLRMLGIRNKINFLP